jgi:hypothetical protein
MSDEEDNPLPLEEFCEDIDSRTGFLIETYGGVGTLKLEEELLNSEMDWKKEWSRNNECPQSVKIFLETIKDLEDTKDKEEILSKDEIPYNNGWKSNTTKGDKRLIRVREYLEGNDTNLSNTKVMTMEQAKFMRAVSHFCLDRQDKKLYQKTTGRGNP